MTGRIIDSHKHAWTTEGDLPWEDSGPSAVERIVYTVENAREDLNAMGVDRACLVATPIHGTGSPYVRRALRQYPDEFYGILTVDYTADDITSRVTEALELPNALGFRMSPGDGERITSPELAPFWAALESHDDPQVQFIMNADTLDRVESVIDANPHVTFVIDHLGGPNPGMHGTDESPYETMSDIAEHSNAHVKVTHTSSKGRYPYEDISPYVRFLVEAFGSERLLWGSDYVYNFKQATPWETLHFLDEIEFLSRHDRRNLLCRTFESLLP